MADGGLKLNRAMGARGMSLPEEPSTPTGKRLDPASASGSGLGSQSVKGSSLRPLKGEEERQRKKQSDLKQSAKQEAQDTQPSAETGKYTRSGGRPSRLSLQGLPTVDADGHKISRGGRRGGSGLDRSTVLGIADEYNIVRGDDESAIDWYMRVKAVWEKTQTPMEVARWKRKKSTD